MIAAIRVPVWSKRRCVQITAFGADDVPDVKINAHRELTSGSSPASSVDCGSSTSGRSRSTTSVGGSLPSMPAARPCPARESHVRPPRRKLPDVNVRSGHVPGVPKAAAKKTTAPSRVGAPATGRELRARGQRTVRKLLDAGIEVFGTKGYFPARVDDIVKVAKTSHGTFYLYFANKEDLFRALVLDVTEEIGELVDSLGPLTPDAGSFAMLRDWLGRFADLHRHYGPVIKAWTEAEI